MSDADDAAETTGPGVSPALLGAFARYGERHLAQHFHAIRLSRAAPAPRPALERPLVVYLNHPSWWDPLVGMALALRLYPRRRHYAPIEAAALARYRLFGRLGFFGVEPGTPRGARRFLAVAQQVLAGDGATLWITPGGRFADPRQRPPELASGLGHLARRLKTGLLVPLALEYPFWEERFPEALARFGEPVAIEEVGLTAADWTVLLAERLAAAQDALAREALGRDPARFETILGGRAEMGGVRGLWRRLRASLRG
jgi:1-acyl-sn-glycerol-3-phosphate acyltransferase